MKMQGSTERSFINKDNKDIIKVHAGDSAPFQLKKSTKTKVEQKQVLTRLRQLRNLFQI